VICSDIISSVAIARLIILTTDHDITVVKKEDALIFITMEMRFKILNKNHKSQS